MIFKRIHGKGSSKEKIATNYTIQDTYRRNISLGWPASMLIWIRKYRTRWFGSGNTGHDDLDQGIQDTSANTVCEDLKSREQSMCFSVEGIKWTRQSIDTAFRISQPYDHSNTIFQLFSSSLYNLHLDPIILQTIIMRFTPFIAAAILAGSAAASPNYALESRANPKSNQYPNPEW